ncbi:prevent-host-death family protein [Tepidimonas alkaliphilus]|uniref:Antitoxin n=1 Tax=Tepidimonas alkaliphilus TaxID=2588942 RepID=A0A554WAH6_9BURK|nr:type II toxin-antitoxin system prevent-host-death family antitoxin [Tepidimonas alkaliphilus]TSE20586.1 prevent-host-death family protein [Tepidimonas alkaliphilus]
MQTVSVHEARERLSALLQAVEAGEEIVITRRGHRVARLVRDPSCSEGSEAGTRDLLRRRALDRLRAYRRLAAGAPAIQGLTDWKTLRDEGRI